jgi:hypothetical protein
MVAAAVDTDQPARVRAAVAESQIKLPVYLATAENVRQYGAGAGSPPLHILIDADGQIAAIAREAGPQTIERIAGQAVRLLEELGPPDDTRFAGAMSHRFEACTRMNSDFRNLLKLFNAYKVRYLVVGGYAVMKYTEPRFSDSGSVTPRCRESAA